MAGVWWCDYSFHRFDVERIDGDGDCITSKKLFGHYSHNFTGGTTGTTYQLKRRQGRFIGAFPSVTFAQQGDSSATFQIKFVDRDAEITTLFPRTNFCESESSYYDASYKLGEFGLYKDGKKIGSERYCSDDRIDWNVIIEVYVPSGKEVHIRNLRIKEC